MESQIWADHSNIKISLSVVGPTIITMPSALGLLSALTWMSSVAPARKKDGLFIVHCSFFVILYGIDCI